MSMRWRMPSILMALISVALIAGEEMAWKAEDVKDWACTVERGEDGVFRNKASVRHVGKEAFAVLPNRTYTLSGEFRLQGVEKPGPFFFGFIPMTADGRHIASINYNTVKNTALAETARDVAAGSIDIPLKSAENWPEKTAGLYAALDAKHDGSDLPNFNVVALKAIGDADGGRTLTLLKPLKAPVKAGTLIRLHAPGPAYLYTGCHGKKLTPEWQKLSGAIQFDKGFFKWPQGTAKAKVIFLECAREGTIEFRNLKVTSETMKPSILKNDETDLARSTIVTVSDSAEAPQYRPASMYDRKQETAWITGRVMREHDIELNWFAKNIDLSGIRLDFTPVDYQYRLQTSHMLKEATGKENALFKGKTELPEEIEISLKQYGQWRSMGKYPIKENIFFHRFPQTIRDVQRIRITFSSAPEHRVAIREIQVPGFQDISMKVRDVLPSLSANGAFYIYAKGKFARPHAQVTETYYRAIFSTKPKVEKAVLTVAAYNRAELYLNGERIGQTSLTPKTCIPQAHCYAIPVSKLKQKNLLAAKLMKSDISDGLYGIIFQLAIRYADGSEQFVISNGKTVTGSTTPSPGWEKELDGFDAWEAAQNRVQSRAYPSNEWSVDFSAPFQEDEVELTSIRLTPEIPVPGQRYQLEMVFNLPKPLKEDYVVSARYGDLPVEMNSNFALGSNMTLEKECLKRGEQGRRVCRIQGTWIEDVTSCLPVRLAVSNGKKQAFIRSRLGRMLPAPAEGQLALELGQKQPVLPPDFPKAELKESRFMIDGKPRAPFFISDNQLSGGRIADQLDANAVMMVRTGKWVPVIADGPDRKRIHDLYLSVIAEAVNYSIRKNPNAKLMLILDLDPLAEWVFSHPDEQIELGDGSRIMGFYLNKKEGPTLQKHSSLSSQTYRKMTQESLEELISRMRKEPYANAIVAVTLGVGLAYENNWGVDRFDFTKGKRTRATCIAGDFGPAARKALVRFLEKRYASEAEWQKAWKLPEDARRKELLSFEKWPHERIQNIMLWKDRPADRFIFRDGQKDGRAAEDMNEFCSLQRAEYLLIAAEAIKKASDNRLIIGSYIGYVFPQLINSPVGSSVYSGHAASKLLRESPHFDFFSSPQWYHTPDSPQFYSVLNDSLRLYGKTFIAEGDIRTHSAAFGSIYNRHEMVNHLRKIGGMLLSKRFGAWLGGWSYGFSGPKGVRFFSDPAILAELKNIREAAELPEVPDAPPGSRIALLVSEHSSWYMDLMSPANTIHANLLYKNLHKFLLTGAGCDILALEDLPRLVSTGKLSQYRFVAFYNAFHLDAELRRLINEKVKADNRTVLFFYAPGFHDDSFNRQGSSISTRGIADILGVRTVSMLPEEHLVGAQWNTGETVDCTVWWDQYQRSVFYDRIGPVFWLTAAPGTEPLADLRMDGKTYPGRIAAASIKGKNHKVIYISVPDISQKILNRLVRESGTSIAAEENTIVNFGNGFLAVTNPGKERQITLNCGRPSDWTELPGNLKTATGTSQVTLPFKTGETRLFHLTPSQSEAK